MGFLIHMDVTHRHVIVKRLGAIKRLKVYTLSISSYDEGLTHYFIFLKTNWS